jgi:hypothetical protein
MKKLQKAQLKNVIGGKLPMGDGCRCVPAEGLLDYCYTVYPQSVWNAYCFGGRRYECPNPNCYN